MVSNVACERSRRPAAGFPSQARLQANRSMSEWERSASGSLRRPSIPYGWIPDSLSPREPSPCAGMTHLIRGLMGCIRKLRRWRRSGRVWLAPQMPGNGSTFKSAGDKGKLRSARKRLPAMRELGN